MISQFESSAPDVVQGPAETVPSLTGSGELVQMPRNVPRLGHSPELRGNPATSGVPSGYASTLPDPMALPQSDVKVGHNKRGKTLKVRGLWPTHKVTLGDPHYLDPALDLVSTINGTGPASIIDTFVRPTDEHAAIVGTAEVRSITEIDLQRAADAILSRHADKYGLEWPRLLGSGYGHSEQLSERIPTDRSSGGATSSDDDYVSDAVAAWRTRHGARRFVASTTYKRRRGKVTSSTEMLELAPDECGPRPVTLPLVTDRNGSSEYGDHGTSIRDRHVSRSFVRRNNRLRACSHPFRVKDGVQVPTTHKEGCRCQHAAAGIKVLGTAITYDAQGTPRETQLLGRRTATTTQVVGWADGGYWLGHKFVRDAVKVATVKRAADHRKRVAAKRAAARASDAARLDAIFNRHLLGATPEARATTRAFLDSL